MKGIGTTGENLKAAISGEFHEMTEMYPEFIAQAKSEKNDMAEMTFSTANQVEKVHHGLYHQALKDLEAAKKLPSKPYYVCQICGNTVEGDAPDKCPICGAGKNMFKKVE
jgi:rubrerythrin